MINHSPHEAGVTTKKRAVVDDVAQDENEKVLEVPNLMTSELSVHSHGRASLTALEIAWLLWVRRTLLARVVFWVLVLSVILAFSIPKRYTATTRLMPPDYRTGASLMGALPALAQAGRAGGGDSSSAMSVANQLLGLNTSSDLIIGVFRSQTVEDRMVTRFDLLKLYRDKYMEDARRDLEKKSQIDVDKKAGIIAVSVEDHLPARASSMAQAYVDEVNALFSSVNTSSAHRERVFVEDRLRDIGLELSAAEKEFSEFASQNNAIDIPQQAKATVEGAAQLQAELMAAQTRLAGLKQIYAPQNARVRDLQAQVVELQHQLEKLDGKNVNPSSGTTPGNDELYPSLRQLPLLGVKYLDLYRRNRVDEAVFELLSKQLEIARIDEAKDIPSLKIMDPPAIPERKSFPHRLWIILSGVTLGFVGISTWVVAREAWLRIDPCDPWKVLATEVYVWLQHALLENKVALGIRVWASRITRSRAASMASSSQPNG